MSHSNLENEKVSTDGQQMNDQVKTKSLDTVVLKKIDDFKHDSIDQSNSDHESECENRNTSTSNAGESEYESANEEELVFTNPTSNRENTLKMKVQTFKNATVVDIEKKCVEKTSNEVTLSNESSEEIQDEKSKKIDNNIDLSQENISKGNEKNIEILEQESEKIEERESDFSGEEALTEDASFEEEELSDNNNLSDDLEDASRDQSLSEQRINCEIDSTQPENENIDSTDAKGFEENEGSGESIEDKVSVSSKKSPTKSLVKSKAELLKTKRNPQYIPRKGSYFEHDDRINENEEETSEKNQINPISEENEASEDGEDPESLTNKSQNIKEKIDSASNDNRNFSSSIDKSELKIKSGLSIEKKPIWDSKEKWSHDKFNLEDQKPKTCDELINFYGYDIRNETQAPKLHRRSKYGKGGQKYSRKSEDENAYAKKTLKKVIKSSTQSSSANKSNNEVAVAQASNIGVASTKKDQVYNKVNHSKHQQPPNFSMADHRGIEKIDKKTMSKDISNGNFLKYSSARNNEISRIYENDRVFVNKTGNNSNSKYSANNHKDNENNKSSQKSMHSQNSTADREQKFEQLDKKPKDHYNNQTMNEENNIQKLQLFTNEDFPELISSQTGPNKNQTSATISNINNKPVMASSTENESHCAKSRVIYYQHPQKQPQHSSQDNEIKRISADVQLQKSDSVKMSLSPPNDYSVNKSNSQSSMIETQQFDNPRYLRNVNAQNTRNSSASTATTHYNSSNRTSNKQQLQSYNSSQIHKKVHAVDNVDHDSINSPASEFHEDSRPKRYSSIRQQQQQQRTLNVQQQQPPPQPAKTVQISSGHHQQISSPSFNQQQQQQPQQPIQQQQQFIMNTEDIQLISADPNPKSATAYYEQTGPPNEIAQAHALPAGTATAANPYANINNSTTGSAPTGATPAAYLAATPNTLMSFYAPAPTTATGQPPPGSTSTGALQAPLAMASGYFTTTDQTTGQPTGQNYYLTTADLSTAVSYHPAAAAAAAYLHANYAPSLNTPAHHHHTHQSHVANRYSGPVVSGGSAESNRYLQTAPSQTPGSILMAGQATYQATLQATAFPSGYPQFPPPPPPTQQASAMGATTSSPLPAGYPNVQLTGSSNTTGSGSAAPSAGPSAATPSGYPEMCRGGITYYDIQSQQQAMQRIQGYPIQTPQSHRVGKPTVITGGGNGKMDKDLSETISSDISKNHQTQSKQHPKNEISVNN